MYHQNISSSASLGVQRRMVIVGQFFRIFEINFLCFVVAIFVLVYDVVIFPLP